MVSCNYTQNWFPPFESLRINTFFCFWFHFVLLFYFGPDTYIHSNTHTHTSTKYQEKPNMSLYEMHYVLNGSEKSRIKEQQATLQKALQELSVKSKLEQQHEHEKLLSRQHVGAVSGKHSAVNFDLWLHSTNYTVVTNECRPYSPYCSGDTTISDAASASTARSNRQRTPSMVSASSSYMSENTASSCYSRDNDSCYSTPTYTLTERYKINLNILGCNALTVHL